MAYSGPVEKLLSADVVPAGCTLWKSRRGLNIVLLLRCYVIKSLKTRFEVLVPLYVAVVVISNKANPDDM